MCYRRRINNRINKLHERALRLAYNDKSSSLPELLEKDNPVTIHERNIHVLLPEIFTCGAAPELMTEIFKLEDHSYDWRMILIFLTFLIFLRTAIFLALRLLWDYYYLVDRYFNNLYSLDFISFINL